MIGSVLSQSECLRNLEVEKESAKECDSKKERKPALSDSSFNERKMHRENGLWFLTDSVNCSETSSADYAVRLKTDPQVVR